MSNWHDVQAVCTVALWERRECRAPEIAEHRIVLWCVNARAQYVAIMAFERVVAAQTRVAARFERELNGFDCVLAHEVFDRRRFRCAYMAGCARIEQHAVVEEQGVDTSYRPLKTVEAR